ncbi:MAG: PEGA domain-containing protein [Patescibacteria group bacterium]
MQIHGNLSGTIFFFHAVKTAILLLIVASVLSGCSIFESKERAGLQVLTDDIASFVYLDGQTLDATPMIAKNLKPGSYQLRIEPTNPEYAPYETTITLRRSTLTVVMWKPNTQPELSGGVIYEMEPLRNSDATEVVVHTIPEGAIVSIEDREKEFSPAVFTDIPAGNREFEISLPSYEVQHHTISVQQGFRMVITVTLAKLRLPGEMDPEVVSDESEIIDASAPATESGGIGEDGNAQPAGTVTIKRTSLFIDDQEVVRVREEPDSNSRQLVTLPVEQSYPYLGETENDWHKIDANGVEGWVNGNFAVLETPE